MSNNKFSVKSYIKMGLRAVYSRRRFELLLIDVLILAMSYLSVQLITMNSGSLTISGQTSVLQFLLTGFVIFVARFVNGVYSSVWRYANVKTYIRLMVSDLVAGLICLLLCKFVIREIYPGFGFLLVYVMFGMCLTLYSRFVYQYLYANIASNSGRKGIKKLFRMKSNESHKVNIAIVGAGNEGATLAEELIRNPEAHYYPFCFIDKDPNKINTTINGIRVIEENDEIVETLASLPVQDIVIALPDADNETKQKLYNLYKKTNCKVKIYDYPLSDQAKETNTKKVLRELKIEDLLFRNSISVKSNEAKNFYKDKVVLVTGGGGSIGSELCRQIAELQPKHLIILDIYENNAYEIQQELVRKYGSSLNLSTVIASVRDVNRIDEIFNQYRPNIVFHAAAHKHVPLMEKNGCEAIKNNVFGTKNVADFAEKYGVEKFLLISTDKAVNPTNIMGASKRLCEMVIGCRQNSKTHFCAVRFGNVLGSNGSVIPLFKKQIENGGPITITDKRIVRYFMTISEAVELVMETCAMAKNGELYVLDMGAPVKILEMAENMIRLSGFVPYEDIDIVEIGLRPGEKLYEELLMSGQALSRTANSKIFIEVDKQLTREEMADNLKLLKRAIGSDELDKKSKHGYHDSVIEVIKAVVPTYKEPEEVNSKINPDEKNHDKSTINVK